MTVIHRSVHRPIRPHIQVRVRRRPQGLDRRRSGR